MLKYKNYVKESFGDLFKIGDNVIFTPYKYRTFLFPHKGKTCEILYVGNVSFNEKQYRLEVKGDYPVFITAFEGEIKKVENKETEKEKITPMQFDIGSRVSVTGKQGKTEYTEQKGTLKKIFNNGYLIEFDEDESKNQSSYTSLIDKDMVTLIEGPAKKDFKVGDKVICIDSSLKSYNKIGEITNAWSDGNYTIEFRDNYSKYSFFMKADQIKHSESDVSLPKKIGFNVPTSKPTSQNIPVTTSYEEEDEDDITSATKVPIKKEDLLEKSYKDFFSSNKISTQDDILNLKKKYESELNDTSLTPFKKTFIEKSLKIVEIVESYYNFLINKIAKDLPVFRTVEQIDNEDLLRIKTKVKASESKEMTSQYSFDQGIVAYWRFKDAVVFKTI